MNLTQSVTCLSTKLIEHINMTNNIYRLDLQPPIKRSHYYFISCQVRVLRSAACNPEKCQKSKRIQNTHT